MPTDDRSPLTLSESECEALCDRYYGIAGVARPLPGYEDLNFCIETSDHRRFVMKFVFGGRDETLLSMQNRVLTHLSAREGMATPEVIPDRNGRQLVPHDEEGRGPVLIRLLSYVPGTLYAQVESPSASLERSLGAALGALDNALAGFQDSALHRYQEWDFQYAPVLVADRVGLITDDADRALVETVLRRYHAEVAPQTGRLRKGTIHNDANDYNVLVDEDHRRVTGIIDFGDLAHSYLIGEVAIACAYAILESEHLLETMGNVLAGYHGEFEVEEIEVKLLYDLVCLRLAISMVNSAYSHQLSPENEYIMVSQEGVCRALRRLSEIDPISAELVFRQRCGFRGAPADDLRADREALLGSNLCLSYREPLKMVRGKGAYLYDEGGQRYLDMVNNVCHVGHCHPKVVAAGQGQLAELNTNTRYLHDGIVRYAERILALFPDPLAVVMFVNSGSEANELALRMARAHTGREEMVVMEGAYHGNTQGCVDVSPYKFDGPGGSGRKPWIHTVETPDPYRGSHRGLSVATGQRYLAEASEVIASVREPAAFICEAIQGVGGQIVLPPGYLDGVYQSVRARGGLCIADEVQIGFGRVGTAWWGFETQGVVPDIVTLGKPMGNGHPLAACVTTRAIADSFANGMEYFNTFGGNPVSCAIGSAVLDVLEEENLREHAKDVGDYLIDGLRDLQQRFPVIGDVRGMGLFIGIELVSDRETRVPDAARTAEVVEQARQRKILLSVDGPLHNVVKIKPPLVFSQSDAHDFLLVLEEVLAGLAQ